MDRVELLLAQLHAVEHLINDFREPEGDLIHELKEALQEATVCAYRLKLGRAFAGIDA
jgi:hypothetical protein